MKKIIQRSFIVSLVFFCTTRSVTASPDLLPDPEIPQVTSVEVTQQTTSVITLHWDPIPLVEGYEIKVTQGDTDITTVRTKKITKTIPALEPDTQYTFQVRARISENYGEYSDSITGQTKAVTTIPFDSEYMIANQLIVKMEKGKKLKTDYPKRKLLISKYTKHKYVYVKINDQADPTKVITALKKLPGVISIEYNGIYTPTTVIPTDTYYSDEWYHLHSGIYSNEAWDEQTGASPVTIAILDTGVYFDHEDLKENMWQNTDEVAGNGIDDDGNGYIDDVNGWDFYNNNADPYPNPDDIDNDGDGETDENVNHGTGVSGVAAAVGNNSKGIAGMMWDGSIMPLQVCAGNGDNDCLTTTATDAVYYAIENGANIINMSFGGAMNSSTFKASIEAAVADGIFVVAGAGNDDDNNLNETPRYPACFTSVFTVAGYNKDGTPNGSYGSNCVELMGPYDSIKSTFFTWSATAGYENFYSIVGGTSFSSPITAGVAGLMLSKNPSLSVTELKNILVATVTEKPDISTEYGAGLVNAGAALAGVDCLNSDDSVKTVTAYYQDNDGDGLATTTSDMVYTCTTPPSSYVTSTTDCNDADKNATTSTTTYYKDADGDGLGDPNTTTAVCSSTAPSGYVSNANDKKDNDYDNDGTSTSNDCNDKDSTVSSNRTYYKDADGDGLGNASSTTAVCSTTAPTGYVTNSSDKNDSDYDNDGTSSSSDCNDKDGTITSNKTYYQDADGDSLGSATVTTLACSTTAPTGYVTNNTDSNDNDFDNDGVETEDDCNDHDDSIDREQTYYADADGDGLGDPAQPTLVCAHEAPTGYVDNSNDNNDAQYSLYSDNDPDDTAAYQDSVTEIAGAKNGKIKVTFSDASKYTYTIFDVDTDATTAVKSYNDTGYLVVVHPKAKSLALVNVYTGEIFETVSLSDKKWKGKSLKLKDLRDDGSTEAIVTGKTEDKVLVTVVKVKPDKSEQLSLKDNIAVQVEAVDVKKTQPKKKTIDLRDENKNVLTTLNVSNEYVLSVDNNVSVINSIYTKALILFGTLFNS